MLMLERKSRITIPPLLPDHSLPIRIQDVKITGSKNVYLIYCVNYSFHMRQTLPKPKHSAFSPFHMVHESDFWNLTVNTLLKEKSEIFNINFFDSLEILAMKGGNNRFS